MAGNADVSFWTLENGLKVVVNERPGTGYVFAGIWVKCGALDETAENNGISHFIEHMAFRGTERYSADAIKGIYRRGGHNDASTNSMRTCYHIKVFPEVFAGEFDILTDMVLAPTFDASLLEIERGVVLDEISRAKTSPEQQVSDAMRATAFPDQPAGRTTLGPAEVIARLTPQDMRAYHDRCYNVGEMVLSVSGDITRAQVEALVAGRLAKLAPKPSFPCAPALYVGGAVCEANAQKQLRTLLAFPGIATEDPDRHAGQVLAGILGQGMNSRLWRVIRDDHGLVYSIASMSEMGGVNNLFMVRSSISGGKIAGMMPLLARELCRIQTDVTVDEVNEAVSHRRMGLMSVVESANGYGERQGSRVFIYGRPELPEEELAAYQRVTPEDVMRVAQRIFTRKPTFAAIGPQEGVPAYEEICGMLPQA